MDPDAQQAALDSLKPSYHKVPEKTGKKAVIRGNTGVTPQITQDPSQTPALRNEQAMPNVARNRDLRPVRQIPLDSYLGQTLKNIKRFGTNKRQSKEDSSSSSSSSSSSDSSESDENSDSDDDKSDEDPRNRKSRRRRSRSKGHKRSKSKHARKSGLKPIAPKEYDGSADA